MRPAPPLLGCAQSPLSSRRASRRGGTRSTASFTCLACGERLARRHDRDPPPPGGASPLMTEGPLLCRVSDTGPINDLSAGTEGPVSESLQGRNPRGLAGGARDIGG